MNLDLGSTVLVVNTARAKPHTRTQSESSACFLQLWKELVQVHFKQVAGCFHGGPVWSLK